MSMSRKFELAMVTHTCNPSTQGMEARVQSSFLLHEVEAKLGYRRASSKGEEGGVCKKWIPKHGWLEVIQDSVKEVVADVLEIAERLELELEPEDVAELLLLSRKTLKQRNTFN